MPDAAPATGNGQRTVAITLVVVAIAVGGMALVAWRDILLLLFAGLVLATALQPLCDQLARRLHLPDAVAISIVYALVTATLVGLAVWLTPHLWSQGASLLEQIPGYYSRTRDWLEVSPGRSLRRIGSWLPEELPSSWLLSSSDAPEGGGPLAMTHRVLLACGAILSIGVLAFYWAVNRQETLRTLLQFVPEHRREFYSELSDTLFMKLGAYVRGQLILCGIVGLLSLIVYLSIGLPYALVLSLVAGLLEAIPIFGPTLGAVPAILVALSISPKLTIMVIIGATLIQTLENYLFVPKVMDRSVGISAVVTLLALVAFGALFGILGAVLAIPLAAIVQTLFDRLVLQADFKEKEVNISRDFSGVMRYQLLDLIQDVKRQQRTKESDIEDSSTAAFNEIEALAASLDDLIRDESEAEGDESPAAAPEARPV